MKAKAITVTLLAVLAAGPASAHEESTGNPTYVFDNWRDQFVPFFDGGDPNTRHDDDAANDETRDDAETRRSMQRWRDEVRTDGSVGTVGEGCMETYCTAVADQNGDVVRVDHTVTVGPSTRAGDRNAIVVEVLGGETEVDLGPAVKQGPASYPDATQAGVSGPGEPEDPSGRPAPDEVHVMTAGDHSLLGAAHSNSDHSPAPQQGNHDAHGGSVWADVYADPDQPTKTRDSRVGIVIMDHLGCQFGCSDEYHTFYPADASRTAYQVGEAPDQAEFVARDPDRWIFGYGPGGPDDAVNDRLNPAVSPLAGTLFDEVVNPYVDPAVAAATGTGPTSSLCCASDAEGNACIPGALQNAADAPEREAFGGCIEIDEDNCFGGGSHGAPPENNGCIVVNGMPFVHGMPASPEDCTAAAAAGCCAAGACQ